MSAPSLFQPNMIYCGDCLEVMTTHILSNSIDLIYVDPPFGTGAVYEIIFKDGVEVRHFKDRWIGGKDGYINWIKPRIRDIHRVLKETGSFYLHCDWHLNAHLRLLCDEIFGEGNFRSEIIWQRTSSHNDPKNFGNTADYLLYYVKSDNYTWNSPYAPFSQEYIDRWYRNSDAEGRRYMSGDLRSPHPRPNLTYNYKGYSPHPNGWSVSLEVMKKMDAEGRLIFPKEKTGRIRRKVYLDESLGQPLQNIWTDINPIHSQSAERLGYPTQKPVVLLERIISTSSNKGDLILDPMCGCGTTLMASNNLGRNWIGIDISPTACKLMAKRLQKVNVKIGINDIIGLPRSIHEIKRMVDLDPIEFQNWVCEKLGAVSTTMRGASPKADGNIDGWIMSTTPIQIKGSDGIGYSEIERFEKTVEKQKLKEGLFVAFSFSKPAYNEALRAKNENGLNIDLLELEEQVVSNPKFPSRPERTTVLKSNITKRVWG